MECIRGAIDAQGFYDIESFPVEVCFWRAKDETMVRRRNPLFNSITGIVPDKIVAFDWLHTLSLGVFQTYLSHLFHYLVSLDMWETKDGNMVARIVSSVCRLAPEVEKWQKAKSSAGRDVSMIFMTSETFGSAVHPTCLLKGGQTNWLLDLFVKVFCRFGLRRLETRGKFFWRQADVCTRC